jgi:hypothetical protein
MGARGSLSYYARSELDPSILHQQKVVDFFFGACPSAPLFRFTLLSSFSMGEYE